MGWMHHRPTQLSFRDLWDCKRRSLIQCIPLLLNDHVVLSCWACHSNVNSGPVPRTICERTDNVHQCVALELDSSPGFLHGLWQMASTVEDLPSGMRWWYSKLRLRTDTFWWCATTRRLSRTSTNREVPGQNVCSHWSSESCFGAASRAPGLFHHMAGWLNVGADQLSHKAQVIGTEWSLHPWVIVIYGWDGMGNGHYIPWREMSSKKHLSIHRTSGHVSRKSTCPPILPNSRRYPRFKYNLQGPTFSWNKYQYILLGIPSINVIPHRLCAGLTL